MWEIRVSRGSRVRIVFVDLDMEAHPDCVLDYVEVRDGPPNGPSAPGARFCTFDSTEGVVSVTTNGSDATVRFRTDYSVSGRGFNLRYFTLCDTVVGGDAHGGVIESPNFPEPYPHNRNCTWTIEAPRGNTVNLTFSHFDVEQAQYGNGTCMYDFVEIREEVSLTASNLLLLNLRDSKYSMLGLLKLISVL